MRARWVIGAEEAGTDLRSYLQQQKGISRRLLKAVKADGGNILVNGQATRLGHMLMAGDCIEFPYPAEKRGPAMKAEQLSLSIVHEDEALIIVDKPAGMAVIPSRNHPNGTLANALLGHYERQQLGSTAHIVTRLDRDTSGLVLVAKNRHTHSLLSESQKAGSVERVYAAIAEGQFTSPFATIDLPIGRKDGSIIERIVKLDGQNAVTHYELRKFSGSLSLLTVRLETGRTHQIRVHLSHTGHPLAGDALYGGNTERIKRQALHCERLSFMHPLTGERMMFLSNPPADMLELIQGMN